VLGNSAAGAAKTGTFLRDKYRRIARRRGSKRAIVAVGRSILIIAWHLLSDPAARFQDLGTGYYAERIDSERRSTTTSASSKPSATPSPSSPLPDHQPGSAKRSAGRCRAPSNSPIFGSAVDHASPRDLCRAGSSATT
jgi:hypothetical protein